MNVSCKPVVTVDECETQTSCNATTIEDQLTLMREVHDRIEDIEVVQSLPFII